MILQERERELLIGISVNRESLEHVMYVFSEENEEMKEIYNRSYTKLFIEDLNENGLKDISLVTFEKDEKLTVEFMEQFKTLSEVSYDPFINSIQKNTNGSYF